jgi:hypothetical protein
MEVRLPNGQVAKFPDTMPRGEIRAFIGSKFPDSGLQYDPNDLLRAQIRLQNTKMEMSRPQPQVENNPYASSLPGPLGQFQDMSSAFQRGAMEGMTGNLSDEIFAGAVSPFDSIARAAQGDGFDLGRSFNDLYAGSSDMRQGQSALNPDAAGAGNVTGALVLGSRLGGLSPMGRASTPLGMGALGALEGAAYGALYGIGGAEGNIADRAVQALPEIGMGALAGGGLGYTVGALGPRISEEARALNRGFEADRIDPASIQSRINAINPEAAVLADLGPNLQGQSAALATIPGPASRIVADALTARRLGANERVRSSVSDILGEPPVLSQVAGEIDAQRKAINTQYEPVFLQKALSDDPTTDVSAIVSALDTHIKRTTGESRSTLERIRSFLTDADGAPISDPRILMSIRHDLDGLARADMNNTVKGLLGEYRRKLDDTLGASVPGLKDVDAQFAEVARQSDALEQGRTVLDSGRNAIDPADLIEQMKGASEGQNFRLSQGARAEINRIIGTKANDRVALQGIIKGDGSWNEQKLRAVFGDENASRLMSLVDSEATMAATENLATSGSRTQVLKAAQEDFAVKPNPSIVREALNFQYGNAAARVADAILGGSIAARREGVNANVARALMARGLSPQMQQEISRLTFGLPGEQRNAIAAALAAQGASR